MPLRIHYLWQPTSSCGLNKMGIGFSHVLLRAGCVAQHQQGQIFSASLQDFLHGSKEHFQFSEEGKRGTQLRPPFKEFPWKPNT